MDPINFKGRNRLFGEGQPQYENLPAHLDNKGKVTSVWKLTDEERERIANGSVVCLCQSTFGRPFQPVNLWIDEVEETE